MAGQAGPPGHSPVGRGAVPPLLMPNGFVVLWEVLGAWYFSCPEQVYVRARGHAGSLILGGDCSSSGLLVPPLGFLGSVFLR